MTVVQTLPLSPSLFLWSGGLPVTNPLTSSTAPTVGGSTGSEEKRIWQMEYESGVLTHPCFARESETVPVVIRNLRRHHYGFHPCSNNHTHHHQESHNFGPMASTRVVTGRRSTAFSTRATGIIVVHLSPPGPESF